MKKKRPTPLCTIPDHEEIPKGWFQVPNAFLDSLKFADGVAVKVYDVLCWNADNVTKETTIGVPRIATLTGASSGWCIMPFGSWKKIIGSKADESAAMPPDIRYGFHPH